MSRFADPLDQLIFSWRGKTGGSDSVQRLSLFPASDSEQDGNRSQRWPGVHGEPPLVVTADSLSFHFLSVAVKTNASPSGEEEKEEGSLHASWGFRLTARSREVISDAGALPPLLPVYSEVLECVAVELCVGCRRRGTTLSLSQIVGAR